MLELVRLLRQGEDVPPLSTFSLVSVLPFPPLQSQAFFTRSGRSFHHRAVDVGLTPPRAMSFLFDPSDHFRIFPLLSIDFGRHRRRHRKDPSPV